jgi:hypothetical protein
LVYGQKAILTIEMELPSLRIAIAKSMDDRETLIHRYAMLEKLDETRAQAHLNMLAIQKLRKTYYNSKLEPKFFNPK